jgi:phosphoglucomutase
MAHKLAGKLPTSDMLEDIPSLISDFFLFSPTVDDPSQRVSFGTSGHRGSSKKRSFNQDHILAITQAICDYRKENSIDGPLYLGKDTHALSTPAELTAIRVLTANEVETIVAKDGGFTPTPAISHAIITHNRDKSSVSDGIVITPSHNPPSDGGFKYNTPNGGPADTDVTGWIEDRANTLLKEGLKGVKALETKKALSSNYLKEFDYVKHYVEDLKNVIDLDAIKRSGIKIAADALGGSGMEYYRAVRDIYGLDITIYNDRVDEKFSFMHLDHDGKIRMDCSSPYAMSGVVELKDRFDIAFGNDTDFDRHGIVTPTGGLMNPNHYLSVAIWYLITHRKEWREDLQIGKTLVSSSMIDRVAKSLGREVYEVPVGFKWYVEKMSKGELAFGGEESAGASFLRFDGTPWSTDKDGIILSLLSAEILAVTGKDPQMIYNELTKEFGSPVYARIDAPASQKERDILKKVKKDDILADMLAGEEITDILTEAPGNGAPIGGIKVVTKNGWFAVRPSGTEDIYKIYAESFLSKEHLQTIQKEAKELVSTLFKNI